MSNRRTAHPMVVTIRPVIADLTLILSALITLVDSAALVLITSHYWPHLHHKYVEYRAVFAPASFPIYLLLLCLITHLAL